MPDPGMVSRAHRAAATLEQAWERWRIRHGLTAGPMPVSSYVGYSIDEPGAHPRVVFGISADEAEILAALLDSHDFAGPGDGPGPSTRPGPAEYGPGYPHPAAAAAAGVSTAPRSRTGPRRRPYTPRPIPPPRSAGLAAGPGEERPATPSAPLSAGPDPSQAAGQDVPAPMAELPDEDERPTADVEPVAMATPDPGVRGTMAAELAGWAAGELPGQASA